MRERKPCRSGALTEKRHHDTQIIQEIQQVGTWPFFQSSRRRHVGNVSGRGLDVKLSCCLGGGFETLVPAASTTTTATVVTNFSNYPPIYCSLWADLEKHHSYYDLATKHMQKEDFMQNTTFILEIPDPVLHNNTF